MRFSTISFLNLPKGIQKLLPSIESDPKICNPKFYEQPSEHVLMVYKDNSGKTPEFRVINSYAADPAALDDPWCQDKLKRFPDLYELNIGVLPIIAPDLRIACYFDSLWRPILVRARAGEGNDTDEAVLRIFHKHLLIVTKNNTDQLFPINMKESSIKDYLAIYGHNAWGMPHGRVLHNGMMSEHLVVDDEYHTVTVLNRWDLDKNTKPRDLCAYIKRPEIILGMPDDTPAIVFDNILQVEGMYCGADGFQNFNFILTNGSCDLDLLRPETTGKTAM